jgi:rieske iron-sulfur protein
MGSDAERKGLRPVEPCPADTLDRRCVLASALAVGLQTAFAATGAHAQGKTSKPKAPDEMRPQEGDRFVFAGGDKQGDEIKAEDIEPDARPTLAWPMDPATKTVRDGTHLNEVMLIRLQTEQMDDTTKQRSADGIVAYSAICTHAQCPVTGWNMEEKVIRCDCHQSEFDPRRGGMRVAGPATKRLPSVPLKIVDGAIVAAGTFTGKVGA